MKKNAIIFPFAFVNGAQSGANIRKKDGIKDLYYKNAIVAAVSAKNNNPEAEVIFISNIEVPNNVKSVFEYYGVSTYQCSFNCFRFDNDYPWCLAFYKLCAIKNAINQHFQNILCLDIDTYTQNNFQYLWGNLHDNIILCDRIGSSFPEIESKLSKLVIRHLTDNRIQRVGGEFIAGNVVNLRKFIDIAELIFNEMKNQKIVVNTGDEYITSFVASMMNNIDFSGGRYICRLETGAIRIMLPIWQVRLIPILHLPAEKHDGMIKMYNYLLEHNSLPNNRKAYKILHIFRRSIKNQCKAFIRKILGMEV